VEEEELVRRREEHDAAVSAVGGAVHLALGLGTAGALSGFPSFWGFMALKLRRRETEKGRRRIVEGEGGGSDEQMR
jgi:16S rRNA C1402 (ribose-2'-O) methylase RsmI